MSYKYNPLLKENLQKNSGNDSPVVTVPKVTKFFTAADELEEGEIAQYQGEDDSVNDLKNGFFYKK